MQIWKAIRRKRATRSLQGTAFVFGFVFRFANVLFLRGTPVPVPVPDAAAAARFGRRADAESGLPFRFSIESCWKRDSAALREKSRAVFPLPLGERSLISSNEGLLMRIDILSLFPNIAKGALAESILGKAQERGLATVNHYDLRDWTHDRHRTADDTPYGGGQGMVMKCEPIFEAVEALRTRETRVLFMTPAGRRFDHSVASRLAQERHLILLCGHYEGVDQRVIDHLVDEELSIGDYVLTNGVIAAAVITDAVVRLIPGVLGDDQSAQEDSFAENLLEYPHYTRPLEFRGWKVPEILLSGHHARIAEWRRKMAVAKTRSVRPDLLSGQNPEGKSAHQP
jgi:tRNA (guanine37-N1)-methyltransferase